MAVLDVLVAGAGPAGYALAGACAGYGLRAAVLDPAPNRPWRATYGAWADELPFLPPEAIAASTPVARVVALTEHILDRGYVVLDNDGLRQHLSHQDMEVYKGKAVAVEHDRKGSTVLVADGRRLAATVVVDASGARRALSGGVPRRVLAEQTAVGAILPAEMARTIMDPGETLFMDWRPIGDTVSQWPTFLYAVPLGGGRVLLEETSLVRRPGLPIGILRQRLHARLAAHGLRLGTANTPLTHSDDPARGEVTEERVRFPVDAPLPRPGRVIPFGVAGGVIHPATGYSVASALNLAPRVAASIASALPHGPASGSMAAWRTVWPPAALAVHGLRRGGMESVLALTSKEVPAFFELFFGLPEHLRRAYLSEREDITGTAAAMITLFRRAPRRLRAHVLLTSAGLRRRPR